MLHIKSKSHRPSGSGEEDFRGVLPCMCEAVILVMGPGSFEHSTFPYPKKSLYEYMKFEFDPVV